MATAFNDRTAALFTLEELAAYLTRALGELDANADAGCENAIPGSELVCGDCASCTAEAFIHELDAETSRRAATAEIQRQANKEQL